MQTSLSYRTNRDLFSNHYLDEQLPETAAWEDIDEAELRDAREDILELWNCQKDTAPQRNESQLEEKFIRPMFRKLGIPFEVEEKTSRTQRVPDYGFFESEAAATNAFNRRKEGGDFYEDAVAVADAKRWGRPLDTRGSGEHERDFENPSYQIHVYLQETPVRWAVLTDGKNWRLYYGPTSHRLDSYYEVDLPTVLETDDLEAFKYFYLFFRHEAFLEDASGNSFLDDVYEESNVFARELGEDLQNNIYEAIKVLADGFLANTENDLSADDLDLIHDSALIFLYRVIFVLYAEAEGRELLDTDNETYENAYSLNTLKQEVADKLDSTDAAYHDSQKTLWSHLDGLFKLIDHGSKSQGISEDELHIPAYNGGLFRTAPDEDDSPEARFLANYAVGDAHLAEVIDLLTRSRNGGGKIFVDYSSLDVRHLGSIYEGLLEYQLNVADEPLAIDDGEYIPADEDDKIVVHSGEVYLTTDSGERKATGSYYTPEYVVEYIIENTLRPLVTEIREDLAGQTAHGEGGFAAEFAERVFELKVLDPAMGSGHFLTNAVDYLAREIVDAQEKQAAQEGIETVDEDRDINWSRRQVAQRCIYGVDVNPLATELAKVSLWLRTLAAEQPLAFLDHHLKTGNSLVGSDIEDVLEDGSDDDEVDDGQLTLVESFDRTRRQALDHVTDRFQALLAIDNETLEDVKEMEAVFDAVRDDPLYRHLLAMANVHTADAFGLDVPSDAYERMAAALRDDSWDEVEEQDWFRSAQAMAAEERFFHWELEFPVAFYGEDGERDEDAGFDAVVGNPPWVNVGRMKGKPRVADYYNQQYITAEYQVDLYTLFLERGMNLLSTENPIGFIVPDPWLANFRTPKIRKFLLVENQPRKIVHTPRSAFPEVGAEHLIIIAERSSGNEASFLRGDMNEFGEVQFYDEVSRDLLREEDGYVVYSHSSVAPILDKVENSSNELSDLYETVRGVGPYHHTQQDDEIIENRAYHSDHQKDDTFVPELRGKHLARYNTKWEGDTWISYGEWLAEPREERFFEGKRLLLREILGERFEVDVIEEKFIVDRGIYIALQGDQNPDLYCTLALLGSSVPVFWFREKFSEHDELFPKLRVAHFEQLPILEFTFELPMTERKALAEDLFGALNSKIDSGKPVSSLIETFEHHIKARDGVIHNLLAKLARQQKSNFSNRGSINLNLLNYLGNYAEGHNLPDIGRFQPTSTDILDATTEDHEKLNIGEVRTERDASSITIYATARYKPEDEDEHETDRWGYTETDYLEAFTLADLSNIEAALVEEFVPVAVEEGEGFAGFRDNATKTTSLVDRLKAITLPDPDDVGDDLRRYVETEERASELDKRIEKTDRLIDEIVYELYGLTEDEIELVEGEVEGT